MIVSDRQCDQMGLIVHKIVGNGHARADLGSIRQPLVLDNAAVRIGGSRCIKLVGVICGRDDIEIRPGG